MYNRLNAFNQKKKPLQYVIYTLILAVIVFCYISWWDDRHSKVDGKVCPVNDFEALFHQDGISRDRYIIEEHFVETDDGY